MTDIEPRPVRCAGCGARLADRVGELVVVKAHVRGGRTRTIVGRELEITCEGCRCVWRSWEPAWV